jgi:hypothetical protein
MFKKNLILNDNGENPRIQPLMTVFFEDLRLSPTGSRQTQDLFLHLSHMEKVGHPKSSFSTSQRKKDS